MSKNWKIALKALVTVGLLVFLVYRMDLRKFAGILTSADLSLLLIATAVQIVEWFLATSRWRVILENFSIRIDYLPLTKIVFIGSFFNLFLPSSIGGDVVRAYYLSKRQNRSLSTTLMTAALERSAGLCALLIIGTVSAAVHRIEIQGVWLLYVFLLLDLAYLAANVALFHPGMHTRLTRLLKRTHLGDIEAKLELVYEGLTALRKNGSAVVAALLISLVIQFFSVVIVWICARAIHIDAPFYVFLIFIPLINLTIMVPLTINGIGLRESAYYLLFSQIGFPVETAVTLSLLNFFIMVLSSMPGAVVYSLYKKDERFEEILIKAETP